MPNETQINEIKRKLGSLYFEVAIRTLQESLKITPQEGVFSDIVKAYDDTGLSANLIPYDTKYFSTSLENWKLFTKLINPDKLIKWTYEVTDCDDVAHLVASLASLILKINTMGVAYGEAYKLDGTFVDRHYFNIVFTSDKELYAYDIVKDGFSEKLEKGKEIIINDWKYKIIKVIYF